MAENERSEVDPFLQPEGAESPQEGGEQEQQAGLSKRQQRVASLLTRLAATARSFLLYDPHNEAISRFIALLLDQFVSLLADEGPLTLALQPFEILFEGEVVYLNRDRDRSLAFRLYRDGVRSLRFRPGFEWEELARLLEILSIRYTGVNQREEDVVTLLWKARFRNLEVVAVEGILPDDDETAGADARWSEALTLPDDVDLPRPELPTPVGPAWVSVSPESLERLRGEASAAHVPEDCVALLLRLREQLHDPSAAARLCRRSAPVHRGARLPALRGSRLGAQELHRVALGTRRAKRRRHGIQAATARSTSCSKPAATAAPCGACCARCRRTSASSTPSCWTYWTGPVPIRSRPWPTRSRKRRARP